MGRRTAIAGVALSITAFGATEREALAAKQFRCAPRGAEIVLKTPTLRIAYRTDERDETEWLWGCRRGSKRRVLIMRENCMDYGCRGPEFRVARRYVAWWSTYCFTTSCGNTIGITDLRSGRRRKIYAGDPYEYGVTATGAVAFTASIYESPTRVVMLGIDGRSAVLDESDSIDRYSLAVGRDTIYWTNAGEPRSARVP